MENERGKMKPSYDTAFLEIVDAGAQDVGDLIVTTLSNDYMPLLRYRIGDLAERRGPLCGNHYIIHGRANGTLTASNGDRVTTWQVDQCFTDVTGIAHYELRQDAKRDCILRFVPDTAAPPEKDLKRVTSRLEELLQTRNPIKTEAMDVLLPAASGKFRLTCPVSQAHVDQIAIA